MLLLASQLMQVQYICWCCEFLLLLLLSLKLWASMLYVAVSVPTDAGDPAAVDVYDVPIVLAAAVIPNVIGVPAVVAWYPYFCWRPYFVGGPVVAFIPAFACIPVVARGHELLSSLCCLLLTSLLFWRHCCCLHAYCCWLFCRCWCPFSF
jgi:hypothetical protein